MKHSLGFILIVTLLLTLCSVTDAQRSRSSSRYKKKARLRVKKPKGKEAIVVDERLSVLRSSPSLYARPIQRMRRGRRVIVLASRKGDGVVFYKVRALPNRSGWVQSEAIVGNFRKGDDHRLAMLIQASDGFAQLQRIMFFLSYFPKSALRPSMLLLFGDIIEEVSLSLSKKASRKLDRREMAASGAPLHSFYLNFSSLDRYRKLGIRFLFNLNTKSYHYDGDSWFEVARKFPKSEEAMEAKKRLITLQKKMLLK